MPKEKGQQLHAHPLKPADAAVNPLHEQQPGKAHRQRQRQFIGVMQQTFASRVDEADRFDEEHLLPIALEIFGSVPFPVTTESVSYTHLSSTPTP